MVYKLCEDAIKKESKMEKQMKTGCAILVLGRVLNIVRFGARSVIFLHIIMTNVAPEYKSDVKAAV